MIKVYHLIVIVMGFGLLGCEKKEPASTPPPVVKKNKSAANPEAAAATPEATPTAEGTPANSEPPPPPPQGAAEMEAMKKETAAEALTRAVHEYYARNGAMAPPLTGLETLVKAGIIKSIPEAPPGMKFVYDKSTLSVRQVKK